MKLGGTEEKEKTTVTSGDKFKPLTEREIIENKAYGDKTLLQKGFDWVKKTFIGDQYQTPKIETYTERKVSPTGEKGTAIISKKITPESEVYIGELMRFNRKADELFDEIYAGYEKNLKGMSGISEEKIVKLKGEKQKEFNERLGEYTQEFSERYEKGLGEIKKSKRIETYSLFGLGALAKKYYDLKEKDELRAKRLGKITPTTEEFESEYVKDFEKYSKFGLRDSIARELAGIEQFGTGGYYGLKKSFLKYPRTILFKGVASAGVMAGATALVTYSSGAGAIASSSIARYSGIALTGIWGGSVIIRTSAGKTSYERGIKLGEITGEELLPIIGGAYIGRKISTKGIAYYETLKTMKQKPEYIAPYKRVRMSILKGEQRFPTAKVSKHLGEFKKARYSLLTDEKRLLSQNKKLEIYAGSHATTSGRFAKVGKRYVAGAGSSEIPAQYFSSEDSLYFALGKKGEFSLYGGSLFGSPVARPYVEAFRSKGFVKIPKGYKPKMTKAEVVAYLKKYAPEYPLKWITRPKGSYWRETAFMIERGRTGAVSYTHLTLPTN